MEGESVTGLIELTDWLLRRNFLSAESRHLQIAVDVERVNLPLAYLTRGRGWCGVNNPCLFVFLQKYIVYQHFFSSAGVEYSKKCLLVPETMASIVTSV